MKHCTELVEGYEKNYPANWPITGLQYALLGKLHWYLQHTTDAVRLLEKAMKILSTTHGTSHPTVVSVLNLLREAEAELSYQMAQEELNATKKAS